MIIDSLELIPRDYWHLSIIIITLGVIVTNFERNPIKGTAISLDG